MKEHPILFSTPMVRAILSGHKTVTRRIITPQPETVHGLTSVVGRGLGLMTTPALIKQYCPYGEPGDLLWCREQHRFSLCAEPEGLHVTYAASPEEGRWLPHRPHGPLMLNRDRPGIHLHRWAARLLLEVTEVRVERVNEITLDDARAEGIPQTGAEAERLGLWDMSREPGYLWDNRTSVENFRRLWDKLNAKRDYPFDAGCWVWAIAFRVPADPARAAG